MADSVEVLRALLTSPAIQIEVVKANSCGIKLRLGDPAMAPAVGQIAEHFSWIVTRLERDMIAIEPRYTDELVARPGTTLFHVSDRRNRSQILTFGLTPQVGGNTTLNRTYPARLHLCHRLVDVLIFTNHQCTARKSADFTGETPSLGVGVSGPKLLADLELFEVISAAGTKYYADSHFDGGIWTESAVPPDLVRLAAPDWKNTYQALFPPPPEIPPGDT